MEEIAHDNRAKLSLFLQVIVRQKVQLLARLSQAQDVLLERLLAPEKLRAIENPELLLRIGKFTHVLMTDAEECIESAAEQRIGSPVHALLEHGTKQTVEELRQLSANINPMQ